MTSGTANAAVDDAQLLRAWTDGDAEAGQRLVERHFESVYRFFRSKLDRGVEDLTQHVFAACAADKTRYRGEGSFRAYVLGIARRTLFKHFRKARREARALEIGAMSVHALSDSPSAALAGRSELALLRGALRRLPLDLQIVLELHYWEEATTAEIAEIVEIPTGTVKTRLARARRTLRAEIEAAQAQAPLVHSTIEGLDAWVAELRDVVANPP